MATEQSGTNSVAYYTSMPSAFSGNSPTYGISSADGTMFNQMLNIPNPAEITKDITEYQGQITREMAEHEKRMARESAEIEKAAQITKLYQAMQQIQLTLSKEAIEITKQA